MVQGTKLKYALAGDGECLAAGDEEAHIDAPGKYLDQDRREFIDDMLTTVQEKQNRLLAQRFCQQISEVHTPGWLKSEGGRKELPGVGVAVRLDRHVDGRHLLTHDRSNFSPKTRLANSPWPCDRHHSMIHHEIANRFDLCFPPDETRVSDRNRPGSGMWSIVEIWILLQDSILQASECWGRIHPKIIAQTCLRLSECV